MALKGTLKDFGIADILQLIGQQTKTGVLYIKSKAEEVEVSFLSGSVARALCKTRKSRELLGAMLVRSGLVTEEQLEEALEIQKRTLKRLGDILVVEGHLTADQLREMTQLQTTETLYKLFTWKTGSYEFIQQDVEHDNAQGQPIRPESILMEGFRRIDEWPMVRKRIPSNVLAFERLKHLDPPPLPQDANGDEVDAALDAALESAKSPPAPVPKTIGRQERLVFKLADPGIDVQRIVDVSRLGEFEACKALYNLVEAGFLKPVATTAPVDRPGARAGFSRELRLLVRRGVAQMGAGLVLVVLFAVAARALGSPPKAGTVVLNAGGGLLRHVAADAQLARIGSALEVYRLGYARYPERLSELAEARLLAPEDLRYPFEAEYFYRPDGDAYVLLPPLR